jgi:hypothetical protein
VKVYAVGGSVRDQLLGIEVGDQDYVVVGSTPEEMQRLGFKPVGRDFPVFLHPQTHEQYALARVVMVTADLRFMLRQMSRWSKIWNAGILRLTRSHAIRMATSSTRLTAAKICVLASCVTSARRLQKIRFACCEWLALLPASASKSLRRRAY